MVGMRGVLVGTVPLLSGSLLTTACSDSPSLSTSQYRAQVRNVCRELRRRSGALPRPERTATARFVRVGRRALALQRDALGRIQSFDAPSTDERTVGRWLDFVDAAIEAGAASLAAQSDGDLAAARAANARGNTATAHADELARLRVDECAAPVTA